MIKESYISKIFKIGTAGFIKDDGTFLYADENEESYHGGFDEETVNAGYPEFSNTHPEEDTCVRLFKEPNEIQYKKLEEVIDTYLDFEQYCKIEIWNNGKYDFYKVFSLVEGACEDSSWEEQKGNWTGYKLIQIIKSYFNKSLNEKIVHLQNGKWQVQSEKGRNMGTYDTKKEAEKRLGQVEYFKHLKEARKNIIVESVNNLSQNQQQELINILEKTFPKSSNYNGNAMYLMPSGKFLDLGDAHLNAEQTIEDYLNSQGLLSLYDKYHFQRQVEDELGVIHIGNDSWNYLLLPEKEITQKQYASLPIYDEYMKNEGSGFDIEKTKDNNLIDIEVFYNFEQDALVDKYERKISSSKIARNLYNRPENLTESSRSAIIAKSKSADSYANGKGSRWTRKSKCSVANTVKDYNKIDMNTFWKEDKLTFGVKVEGETNNYIVTISFNDILPKIQRKIHENKKLLEFKCIYDALIQAINSGDVKISCTCPDYKYRLKYWNSQSGDEAGEKETRAADKTNPNNSKGPACKHILAVLNNVEWLNKIASVINNYANYCKDNMEYNYSKFIFPKLYGMPYNKAVQMSLEDYNENGEIKDILGSEEALINLSNALGKERGRFKKGSNKNPTSKKNDKEEK